MRRFGSAGLLLVFALLQAGDYLSTRWALAHGERELNPLLQDPLGQLAAKLVACGLFALLLVSGRRRPAVLVCLFYAALVGLACLNIILS